MVGHCVPSSRMRVEKERVFVYLDREKYDETQTRLAFWSQEFRLGLARAFSIE